MGREVLTLEEDVDGGMLELGRDGEEYGGKREVEERERGVPKPGMRSIMMTNDVFRCFYSKSKLASFTNDVVHE